MGLSRLDNFLKSVRGNILYVDPNNLDSTDSVANQGNSPTRPFKTIQRALIEAARFSYQVGNNNDRFSKTTILLQPGEHIVDNRPGIIVKDDDTYITRGGFDNYTDFTEFTLLTNFDVLSENNQLYKLNSTKRNDFQRNLSCSTHMTGRFFPEGGFAPQDPPSPGKNGKGVGP